uniref:Holin n=1 Tax=viral metagenome TaxID=1070528 RepID=A0A6C0J830_9ZZZZ
MLDSLVKMGKESSGNIILVMATLIGAFGGFPQPPKFFAEAVKWGIVQWFLVFVLAYQGGAGASIPLAAGATAVTFVLYKIIRSFEKSDDDLFLL